MVTTSRTTDAFLRGLGAHDAEALGQLFADEVDWFVPGTPATTPWAGRRSRKDEVADYFRTLWAALVPGVSAVTIEALVIEGGDAVVLATFDHVAAPTGRPFHTAAAMHLTVTNHQITRFHLYEDTAAVAAAFTP